MQTHRVAKKTCPHETVPLLLAALTREGRTTHQPHAEEACAKPTHPTQANNTHMSATTSSGSATPRQPVSNTHEWLQRVATVQRRQATPAVMEELRTSAERARHAELMHRTATRVRQSRSVSSAIFHSSLSAVDEMAASPLPAEHLQPLMRARTMDATSAMTMLSSADIMSPSTPVAREETGIELSVADEEAEEERRSIAFRNLVEQQVSRGTLNRASAIAALSGGEAGGAAEESSLAVALKQLEKEPQDEAEMASKFELFTSFQSLTEASRDATMELWRNVKADFDAAPATQRKIEADIKAIDGEHNMGIVDDPRRWFVHSMCKTAARNQRQIDGVLHGVTTKLELLASQTACPICFEDFDPAERLATTLGCAHKTCQECWTHWSSINGGAQAACPLCRHTEFLGGLFRAAGDAASDVAAGAAMEVS